MTLATLLEAGRLRHVNTHLRRLIEFSVLNGAAILLTIFVTYPVQLYLMSDALNNMLFMTPSLLFLPSIIKALAAWMFGWWAILYILPTSIILHQYFLDDLHDWNNIVIVAIYILAAPVVKFSLELLGFDFLQSRDLNAWRFLFVILTISSLLTASSILLVQDDPVSVLEFTLFNLLFVLGDTVGAVVFLLSFLIYFRLKERSEVLASSKE